MSAIDFNEKAIESEVFRFVSVRNVQKISKTQANRLSFVYPEASATELYDDLVAAVADPANATEVAKLDACKTLAETYKSSSNWIADENALNLLFSGFEGLYDWFQSNLNTITMAMVSTKLADVVALEGGELGQA